MSRRALGIRVGSTGRKGSDLAFRARRKKHPFSPIAVIPNRLNARGTRKPEESWFHLEAIANALSGALRTSQSD
jgi:hypothetical protein